MRKGISIQKKYFIILISIIILLLWFFYWQNNSIEVNYVNYQNVKIPKSFQGFKILHVSDLHNKNFGKNQSKLIAKTKKSKPDIIVITGDLVDSHRLNIEVAMDYVKQAVTIAPVFYVTGNHERWSEVYPAIKDKLLQLGVTVLDNESITIKKGDDKISIVGMMDPNFMTTSVRSTDNVDETLSMLANNVTTDFSILLSHRPELISNYANKNLDIVFSGHAHGGQFRLPFIGGLYAPNQGFNPTYTSGLYREQNTTMLVSRGLGNSVIPIRIFNRPELIVVTLSNE